MKHSFKGLKPDNVARSNGLQPKEYAAGQFICKEGDHGNNFYIIIQGVVSVTVKGKRELDVEMHGGFEDSGDEIDDDLGPEKIEAEVGVEAAMDMEPNKTDEIKEVESNYEGSPPNKEGDNSEGDNSVTTSRRRSTVQSHTDSAVQDVEICRMRGGDFFGEVALLNHSDDHIRSASVVAISSVVKVFSISAHNFHKSASKCRLNLSVFSEAQRRLNIRELQLDASSAGNFIQKSLDVDSSLQVLV